MLSRSRILTSVWLRSATRPLYTSPNSSSKASDEDPKDSPGLKDAPIDIENPFEREKKQCILCAMKIIPNYKNVKLLSQFQSSFTGRIYGRHITGLCSKQQTLVENEIGKAQRVGIMAYYLKEVEFIKDPKLFNPSKPIRQHRF